MADIIQTILSADTLAEIGRLRREIERWKEACDDLTLEVNRRQGEIERLRAVLRAVDELWSKDALEFADEMKWESPVGKVWTQVRRALEDKP